MSAKDTHGRIVKTLSTPVDSDGALSQLQNIALQHEGISAARIHGEKYIRKGRKRSEDSFHVESNYSGRAVIGRDDADTIMRTVTDSARNAV